MPKLHFFQKVSILSTLHEQLICTTALLDVSVFQPLGQACQTQTTVRAAH